MPAPAVCENCGLQLLVVFQVAHGRLPFGTPAAIEPDEEQLACSYDARPVGDLGERRVAGGQRHRLQRVVLAEFVGGQEAVVTALCAQGFQRAESCVRLPGTKQRNGVPVSPLLLLSLSLRHRGDIDEQPLPFFVTQAGARSPTQYLVILCSLRQGRQQSIAVRQVVARGPQGQMAARTQLLLGGEAIALFDLFPGP